MKTFLAGGSGVIGLRLIPLLKAAGHDVAATTRSPSKTDRLGALGAVPVVVDLLDPVRLLQEVGAFRPDLVIHQVTHLPDNVDQIRDFAKGNNRVRREGTANLVQAVQAVGSPRLVAQSVAWTIPGEGGQAVRDLERQVLAAGGVVVRYGQFYGPDTFYPSEPPAHPRVHVDDAAQRTLQVLDAETGIVTIVEG